MKTVKAEATQTEVIKKSKFIGIVTPIRDEKEAKEILKKYRAQYKDATHICYSYILEATNFKYSDDGEPTNSGGLPIYKALSNKNLIYTMALVVRYFGGIKLGANGLVHAYSDTTIKTIEASDVEEYKKFNEYIIEIPYSLFDTINHYLNKKGIAIIDKQFLDNVFISLKLDDSSKEEFQTNFPKVKLSLVE